MEKSWVCHTITLSHMLGRRERSLRKLKEGERVVDSTSNKNLSSFVFLGLRIKVLVGNTGSSLPVKQGANRPLWFASSQSLTYLDGSLPGDYGFDPLGLSDPESTGGFIEPRWPAYGESR